MAPPFSLDFYLCLTKEAHFSLTFPIPYATLFYRSQRSDNISKSNDEESSLPDILQRNPGGRRLRAAVSDAERDGWKADEHGFRAAHRTMTASRLVDSKGSHQLRRHASHVSAHKTGSKYSWRGCEGSALYSGGVQTRHSLRSFPRGKDEEKW